MAEVAVDDVLFPLKLRIDALFAENGGRVGDSKEERERFHDKVYDLTYSWMEDYEKHSTPASSPERQLLPALVHAAEEEQKMQDNDEVKRQQLEPASSNYQGSTYTVNLDFEQTYTINLDIKIEKHRRKCGEAHVCPRPGGEHLLTVRQTSACRVWATDASLARWLWVHSDAHRPCWEYTIHGSYKADYPAAYGHVLVLGAGAGLAGLAVARHAKRVVLTDKDPLLLPNLRHNCRRLEDESPEESPLEADLQVAHLDWSADDGNKYVHLESQGVNDVHLFDTIIASDVCFSSDAATKLAATAHELLRSSGPGGFDMDGCRIGGEFLMCFSGHGHGKELVAELEKRGAYTRLQTVPAVFFNDLPTKNEEDLEGYYLGMRPYVLRASWPEL